MSEMCGSRGADNGTDSLRSGRNLMAFVGHLQDTHPGYKFSVKMEALHFSQISVNIFL